MGNGENVRQVFSFQSSVQWGPGKRLTSSQARCEEMTQIRMTQGTAEDDDEDEREHDSLRKCGMFCWLTGIGFVCSSCDAKVGNGWMNKL